MTGAANRALFAEKVLARRTGATSDHAFAMAMNGVRARKSARKQEGPPRMQAGDPSIVSMRFP